MDNTVSKKKKIDIITLIGNILLWILLLPSVLFSFGSIFAADAGFTSKLHEVIVSAGIMLAFYGPAVVLLGAIVSLVLRLKKRYVLSFIFVIIPVGWLCMACILAVQSVYVK